MLNDLLALGDDSLFEHITELLKSENAVRKLDEIDDELIEAVQSRPLDVGRLVRTIDLTLATLPDSDERRRLKAYNFNTSMIAAFHLRDYDRVLQIFSEGIAFCEKHALYEPGKSIARNVIRFRAMALLPADEATRFLRRIRDFYIGIERHSDAVETLCDAALQFADAGAFQSAYRALADAQDISLENRLPRSQLLTLETQGMVALIEGDLDCARKEFDTCKLILEQMGKAPSFRLRANIALVEMRSGHFTDAASAYTSLIDEAESAGSTGLRHQLLINLLVCLRESDDESASMSAVDSLDREINGLDGSSRIEGRIGLAKALLRFHHTSRAISQLVDACREIDKAVDKFSRLHYRRGAREQYIGRIRVLLSTLPDSGNIDDILLILVACSSNGLLDWLSVLKWCDEVALDSSVSDELRLELKKCLKDVIDFGTPFLYGFYEKYDDPFETPRLTSETEEIDRLIQAADHSRPWRRFNDVVTRIRTCTKKRSPFDEAGIEPTAARVSNQLQRNLAVLFAIPSGEQVELFILTKNRYLHTHIPTKMLLQFGNVLRGYQHFFSSRSEFLAALSLLQKQTSAVVAQIVSTLENEAASGLITVSEYWSQGFPLLPSILASDKLRAKILVREFVYRECPALWAEPPRRMALTNCAFLYTSTDQLELAEAEAKLIAGILADRQLSTFDLNDGSSSNRERSFSDSDILHLSMHGVPAHGFTDPKFVSISANGELELDWVQRKSHGFKCELVFLNGCNTATTSNENYFRTFSSNEQIGISSAFLLNRKGVVVASHWNVPEMVAYVFSCLLYRRLEMERDPAIAFATAMADIYELSSEQTIEIIETITDEDQRVKRVESLRASKGKFPFRNAYVLGMYQLKGLLVDAKDA